MKIPVCPTCKGERQYDVRLDVLICKNGHKQKVHLRAA